MKTSSSVVSSGIEQLSRKCPKTTRLDLEKMFQQSIELAAQYEQLQKQNQQIKYELNKVDALRTQRQELICTVESVISQKSKELDGQTKTSSWLVFKLKKQLHMLKRQIEAKGKVIKNFIKDPKLQLINQKQTEIENTKDLRGRFATNPNLKNSQQSAQLYQYRLQYRLQQQIIDDLENQLELEHRHMTRLTNQIENRRQETMKIQEEQEQLRQLQQMANLKRISMKMSQSTMQDRECRRANEQFMAELEQTKLQKHQQIKELEQSLDRMMEWEKKEKEMLEKQEKQLIHKLERLKNPTTASQQKNIQQIKPKVVQEVKSTTILAKVKPQHIAHIGKFLKFNMAVKKYTHTQWKNQLFLPGQTTVSIKTLIQRLQKKPFELADVEQAKLLARYLVEDDRQKIHYNEAATETVPIMKCILEKVIGDIKIYTKEEEERILNESSSILNRYKALVVPALQSKAQKSNVLSDREITQVIDGCSLDLGPEHIDYVILYLFSFSKNLKKMKFIDIEHMGTLPLQYVDK